MLPIEISRKGGLHVAVYLRVDATTIKMTPFLVVSLLQNLRFEGPIYIRDVTVTKDFYLIRLKFIAVARSNLISYIMKWSFMIWAVSIKFMVSLVVINIPLSLQSWVLIFYKTVYGFERE